MKNIDPINSFRVAKTLKPRNPVLAALKAGQGAGGAGPHRKKRGAVRRAEKMAIARETAEMSLR